VAVRVAVVAVRRRDEAVPVPIGPRRRRGVDAGRAIVGSTPDDQGHQGVHHDRHFGRVIGWL
jgi:hypothetical protein